MPNEPFNPIAQPSLPGAEPEPFFEEDKEDKAKKDRHLATVRAIILIGLVVLVFLGIFLTLNYVPKIANNISSSSKSLTSILTSKKTATSTTTPVATATTTQPTQSTQPSTAIKTKTPAQLVPVILSTQTFGNRTVTRFNIQNVGGTASGPWSFTAQLPSSVTPQYYSQTQSSLSQFSGVVYTLEFTADQYAQNTMYTNAYSNTSSAPIQITTYMQNGVSGSDSNFRSYPLD